MWGFSTSMKWGVVGLLGGVVEMRKATVPKDFDTVAESGHL